jgi:putative holliday junction resolvase
MRAMQIEEISMRIMGLDYGTKTIGVAISDPLCYTAQGIETITRKDPKNLIDSMKRIQELIATYQVTEILVGMPINMNNTEGERVQGTNYFVNKLKNELEIPISTFDERLSTIAANRILEEANVQVHKRKDVIDKIAASLILQTYLDLRSNQKKKAEQ